MDFIHFTDVSCVLTILWHLCLLTWKDKDHEQINGNYKIVNTSLCMIVVCLLFIMRTAFTLSFPPNEHFNYAAFLFAGNIWCFTILVYVSNSMFKCFCFKRVFIVKWNLRYEISRVFTICASHVVTKTSFLSRHL